MSQKTFTITTPNGAKVRTTHSKRYFVVSERVTNYVGYDVEKGESVYSAEYKAVARVEKRTDSAIAAQRELKKSGFNWVYVTHVVDGKIGVRLLTDTEVHNLALNEKQNKAFADRKGTQGQARSLWY